MALMKWLGWILIILGLVLRIAVDYFPSSIPLSEGTGAVVSVIMIILGAIIMARAPQRPSMVPVPA